jgi:hypothetical protein
LRRQRGIYRYYSTAIQPYGTNGSWYF